MTCPINYFCMPPRYDEEELFTKTTYQQLFYRIERLALNAVRWDDLPDNINQMLIERYLYYFGQCVFFKDEILNKYLVLPMATQYAWDENGYPTDYEVIGFMNYRRRLNIDNSVIIWNNFQTTPSIEMAALFATRLTNTLRTGDMHLDAQKHGKILAVPEVKRKGVSEIIRRIKNFNLFTIVSPAAKELGESVSVLDTELEYIVDKLDAHYSFLWHDCMSFFGIKSISDKKSGIGEIEAEAENSMSDTNGSAILYTREDAVKKINAMFNLNLNVRLTGKEEAVNGELYDDIENSDGNTGRETQAGDIQ